MNILYLCDRRACEKCSPECHHTCDISHAKNFELGMDGVTIVETAKPLVVLKTNAMFKKEVLKQIREELTAQIASGVIFCDSHIEPIRIDPCAVIYDVSITERMSQCDT